MKYIAMIIAVSLIAACSKEKEEIDPREISRQWDLRKAELPATGVIGQPVAITVYYPTASGCDQLDTLCYSQEENIVSLRAYGHTNTKTICTQDATVRKRTFYLPFAQANTYELRFISRDSSYFSHPLTVN